MRFASSVSGASTSTDGKSAEPSAVVVRVGVKGLFGSFKHIQVMGMDRVELLEALESSKFFASSIKDVDIDKCSVEATVSTNLEPDTNAVWTQLKSVRKLSELFQELGGTAKDLLFLRIGLPSEAAARISGESVMFALYESANSNSCFTASADHFARV